MIGIAGAIRRRAAPWIRPAADRATPAAVRRALVAGGILAVLAVLAGPATGMTAGIATGIATGVTIGAQTETTTDATTGATTGAAQGATPTASQAGFGAAPLDLPADAPLPDNRWIREPAGRLSGAFARGVAQRYSDARAVSAIADLKREGVACVVNTNTAQTGGDIASQGFVCTRRLAAHGCMLTWTVRLQTFRGEMRQTAARFERACERR